MATTKELPHSVAAKPEPHVSEKEADVTFNLIKGHGGDLHSLDLTGQRRLNRKLYYGLVPFLLFINLLLFVRRLYLHCVLPVTDVCLKIDKATLAYASILGLFEDTNIGNGQYNNLNTLFYAGNRSTIPHLTSTS